MSNFLFNREETLCNRQGNKCKRRGKCNRHERTDRDGWESNYYQEFGKYCDYFQVLAKTEKKISPKKALEHSRDIETEIRKNSKD